jgi:hypothetical protein
MHERNRFHRFMSRAAVAALGSAYMNAGCSPEALRALIIGLDAAAGQIQEENGDVSFEDWLESEFDDVFDN